MKRREFLKYLGIGGALSVPFFRAGMVSAAKWPERPIRVVIGYKAGGGTDTFTRVLVAGMEAQLNATINVTNMPGSVAAVATDFVWNKAADGYFWAGTSNYNKFLRAMKYHTTVPWRDWQWYPAAGTYQGWAVRPDSPFKTFQDLLDAARKKPVTMSHAGIGGIWHEGDAIMAKAAGVKFNYIPYKGGAPATLALIKGEVDAVGNGIHEQVEFLKAGKLRNLAVFTDKPLSVGALTLEPVTKYVPKLKPYTPFGGDITPALKRDVPLDILKMVHKAYRKALDNPRFEAILKKKVGYKILLSPTEVDKVAARKECVTAWTFKDLGIAKADPAELGIPRPEEFEAWWPPKEYKPRLT